MTKVMESALEVAVDAITRRARLLEGQDPEVAEALLLIASRVDLAAPCETRKKKGIRRHYVRSAGELSKKAKEAWL